MANITLAWQNRTDEGTLSGGSWLSTLPLTNLQDRTVQKVARSSNALTESTQFDIDLSQARSIGALALVVHNISVSGKFRVTAADASASFSNYISSPSNMTAAGWTTSNLTVSADVATAPDGGALADKLVEDVTATPLSHSVLFAASGVADDAILTASVYVKAAERTFCRVSVRTKSNSFPGCIVNLSTGVITSTISSPVSTSVTDAGDGWYRVTVTADVGVGATQPAAVIFLYQSASTISYIGDGVSGIYAWGASLTLGDGIDYDSGWRAVWPSGMIPQSLLEWEEDNFWLGTLSSNSRAGYQSPLVHLLPTAQVFRYWRVEISDATNSDGYVQVGRLFISSSWTPAINYTLGATLGYTDSSPVDRSLSGAEFFDVRSRAREFELGLDGLTDSEAYDYALQIQRLAGTTGEVLVVPDSADTSRVAIRSYLGRLVGLSPLEQVQQNRHRVGFRIRELL